MVLRRMTRLSAVLGMLVLSAAPAALSGGPVGAETGARAPRIGILIGRDTPIEEGWQRGMRELGYVDGKNVVFEIRHARGAIEKLPALAGELVERKVDLIFASSGPAAAAARRKTATIPIVFVMLGDPVAARWAKSYARPGGNMSGLAGLSPELAAKRLELLKTVVPQKKRVAVFVNPSNPVQERGVREIMQAARAIGVEVLVLEVRKPEEIPPAFAAMAAGDVQALMVLQDVMFAAEPQRSLILRSVAAARLPALYVEHDWVISGGLMSYAPSLSEMGHRAAAHVDMILKGARAADLPIELPTKFDLVLNLKTANALGLTIPQSILISADRVIE
jgi:putative ABC transport system substrate-binding protein